MKRRAGDKHFAERDVMAYGSLRSQGTTRGMWKRLRRAPYASPCVSNIAALIASAAFLPAQTTNWNAG